MGCVDADGDVRGGFSERFGTSDYEIRFITVEFQEVVMHPAFYCVEAGGSSGQSGGGDGVVGAI